MYGEENKGQLALKCTKSVNREVVFPNVHYEYHQISRDLYYGASQT